MKLKALLSCALISTALFFSTAHAGIGSFLYGSMPQNEIYFFPYSEHFVPGNEGSNQVNWLTGATVHSVTFGAFRNSFNYISLFVGVKRHLLTWKRLALNYSAGFMSGYHGKLLGDAKYLHRGVLSVLFNHNVNPYVEITPKVLTFGKHFYIGMMITPATYALGFSYAL